MGNPDQATEMTKEELLSYAAAYIDGDGCITVCAVDNGSSRSLRCVLEVGGIVKKTIEYIEGLLGPGEVTSEKDGTFRLRYKYADAAKKIERIRPYLYLKRPQAELVLQLNSMISKRGFRRCDGMPSTMREAREAIWLKVHQLNHSSAPLKEHAPKSKRRSFAYLAGIIDSEGCLQIERKGNEFSPVVHVRMTDGYVCRWIEETFGGYFLQPSPSNDVYTWGAERKIAVSCLRKALPYLKSKREQAEILIRMQRNKDLLTARLHGIPRSEYVIQKWLAWKIRVSTLNQSAGAETKPTQPISVSDSPICRNGKSAELQLAALA